jgi:hypothetical protein
MDIDVYITDSPAILATDVFLTTLHVNVNLAPGAAATYTANVVLPATLTPGLRAFGANVDAENNIAEADETNNTDVWGPFNLDWQFGQVGARTGVVLSILDQDGTLATFSMRGPGTGTVNLNTVFMEQHWDLATFNTNITTQTTIGTNRGGDGRILLDGINAGDMLSFNAPTTNVDQNITFGGIRTLNLGNVFGGLDLDVGVAAGINQTAMTLGFLDNVDVTSLTPLSSFRAAAYTSTASDLVAPWIGTLAIAGDCDARMNLNGVGAGAFTLNTATIGGDLWLNDGNWVITGNANSIGVTGWVEDSRLRISGNLNSFSAGGMDASLLFAGINGALTVQPTLAAQFVTHQTIGSVTIKGIPGAAFSFINSNIAAWNITGATLRNIDTVTGGPFGVAADRVRSLTRIGAAGKTTWKNLAGPAAIPFFFDGQFRINLV